MGRLKKYPGELRERAVRLVLTQASAHESQWATFRSVAAKLDRGAETLRKWVRQAERDLGRRGGDSFSSASDLSAPMTRPQSVSPPEECPAPRSMTLRPSASCPSATTANL